MSGVEREPGRGGEGTAWRAQPPQEVPAGLEPAFLTGDLVGYEGPHGEWCPLSASDDDGDREPGEHGAPVTGC